MTATVLSYFMADDVRFESNGKVIAIGMYYNVSYKDINSARTNNICIFATITDLSEGEHTVSVQIDDLDESKSLDIEGDILLSDGEEFISTLLIKIPGFIFPHSGGYSYKLIVDDEKVANNFINISYSEEPIREKKKKIRRKTSTKAVQKPAS